MATALSLPECEHRRPGPDAGRFGCRVQGVCTPTECLDCSARSGSNPDALFELLYKPQPIGTNYHRSGWPLAFAALRQLHDNGHDLLLDDFVEQTWIYSARQAPLERPWVGIFHHPPHPPNWSRLNDRLDSLPENDAFRRSCQHLQLAICLSRYLADWIAEHWQVPTAVVTHPTGFDGVPFNLSAWHQSPRVTQVGWYLRNTRLIHQIDTPVQRTRVLMQKSSQAMHDEDCGRAFTGRPDVRPGEVADLPYLANDGYDWMLSRSVIVQELLDASANNVTLECIARGTPLIVNRHPAVVEYLGEAYPLFYDDWREIPNLLHDHGRIASAHCYLSVLDKRRFTVAAFRQQIAEVLP